MLRSRDELLISYASISIYLYIFCTTYAVWSIRVLITHRKRQYFVKRRSFLVGATIISNLFSILSFTNLFCVTPLLELLDIEHENDTIQWLSFICAMTGWIFGTFTVIAATLFLIRVWLLYFDMELSQLLKNQHWQMAINPKKISNNWFLNPYNQRRFGGNGQFLLKIGLAVCLIQRLCFVVLSLHGYTIAAVVSAVFVVFVQVKCCYRQGIVCNRICPFHL